MGAAGKAWDGAMVWDPPMGGAGGSQGRMLSMEPELGLRSGWPNMGLDRHGLVADSGRHGACCGRGFLRAMEAYWLMAGGHGKAPGLS